MKLGLTARIVHSRSTNSLTCLIEDARCNFIILEMAIFVRHSDDVRFYIIIHFP
jgi:hypothetical protein